MGEILRTMLIVEAVGQIHSSEACRSSRLAAIFYLIL